MRLSLNRKMKRIAPKNNGRRKAAGSVQQKGLLFCMIAEDIFIADYSVDRI